MKSPYDIIAKLDDTHECIVWADALGIDRGGTKSLGISGFSDKWRITVPTRASRSEDGEVVMVAGQEINVPSPLPTRSFDAADLIHDADVQALVALAAKVGYRIITGDLKPLPIPEVTNAPV